MSPQSQQKFNTLTGSLLLVLGLFAWGTAVFYALVPNKEVPPPVITAPQVDLTSCTRALVDLGYQASVNSTTKAVEAFERIGDDPERQLEKASLGVKVCGLQLQTFCAGEGCTPRPGISFSLVEPSLQPEKKPAEAAKPTGSAPAAGANPISAKK